VQILKAGNSQNTIGWPWNGMDATGGGNTAFGWMSMNSRDCDDNGNGTVEASEQALHPSCPGGGIGDYGVNIPSGNGDLFGYGWSENYGWMSFNAADVSGCPVGTCSARRNGNSIQGWGRILSIRDAGANSGGWSGFVSLDSLTTSSVVPYGVSLSGNNLSGYAWSDELGWIDFTGVSIAASSTLKICQDSCGSSFLRGQGNATKNFSLIQGTSQDLVACYNTAPDCSDPSGDVTAATAWAETDAPDDAISLSSVSNKERVTGNAVVVESVENFTAVYSGATATMTVSVVSGACSTNGCETTTCTGLTCDNGCAIVSGTKDCRNYNWIEVAP